MITAAGQGDMEVKKVSSLYAAVTGYGPLIYDLPPDAGFIQFYESSQAVWKNLESDHNLPKKLVCS